MCDQTEVSYHPGNVVWVKLNPVWWPGVVADSEEIPPDVLDTLRKTPIAIVKFFQETGVYEYVYKLTNIYHYNCLKKNDFIRKGLDMYRSKNRDAPSNMKLFPSDVARAEVLTGGNPNIVNDEMFQPEEKPTYADLFSSTKKNPKKIKPDTKKRSSKQAATPQPNASRIITHPRFIKLNSGLATDYEVRERKQEPIRAECDEEDNSPPTTYRCQECEFSTIRLNVIVLHNKSHTRNYAKPTPVKASKRKNISAVRVLERPAVSEWELLQKAEPVRSKISAETNGTIPTPKKRSRPKKVVEPATTVTTGVATKTKEGGTKTATRQPAAKPKRSTPQKDEFQESLLEDWAEFETEQDNVENGDTSLASSANDTQQTDEKTVDESCSSAGKKDEFDFDDTEEQLVIDQSKIRVGRKIPRVLEEKSEEVKKTETEIVKKRRTSGVRAKQENAKTEVQENEIINSGTQPAKRRHPLKQENAKLKIQENAEKDSESETVKRRRVSSSLRKKSEDTKTENHKEVEKNSESMDVKRRKMSRTRRTSGVVEVTKVTEKAKVADDVVEKNDSAERKKEIESIEDLKENENVEASRVEEITANVGIEESTTEIEIEEMHEEIEVGGEIEIEMENTIDDEPISTTDAPVSPAENENRAKEKEVAEFSQKVDELLQEVSVPSKLPELPRSLKKDQIKSHNANLTDNYDDRIIESISLINDDSSDGFEEKKSTDTRDDRKCTNEVHAPKKRHSSCETQNSTSSAGAGNIEITSDSSPELVSIEMPAASRGRGFAKKKLPTIVSASIASTKRPPVRFTMASKLKNTSLNPVVKKNPTQPQLISDNSAKLLKNVHQQKLLQSRARSMLKQVKSLDGRHNVQRSSAFGQQAATNTSRTNVRPNSNKVIVVKPMSTQQPTTIDNIDLTGSKDSVVSSGQISDAAKPSRLPRSVFSRTTTVSTIMTPKNVVVSSHAASQRPATSTIKLVSSSGGTFIPLHDQSEIITVGDDVESTNDNGQVEEINYIVDEAGNVIVENDNSCATSKKEDILAKALQDTDVLPTEITLPTSSTILLESCNIMKSSPSTTVYENVTLNTPPIMSSFETPSRTVSSSNPIPEMSEYIIISDADNM